MSDIDNKITENTEKQSTTQQPHMELDENGMNTNDNALTNGTFNSNQNNDNESLSSSSPSTSHSLSPVSSSAMSPLKKAEKALLRLLDHSHELTTKLRQRLNMKTNGKHRKNSVMTEEAENAILANDLEQSHETDVITHFGRNEQPSSICGTMYPYQIEGLNWMIQLFELNRNKCFINGILADEMGLGKTLETISLLSYLKQYRNINGPHIIIVPLSTAANWCKEFKKWNPSMNVVLFHGDQIERETLKRTALTELYSGGNMDVLVTSYEIAMIEKTVLNKIKWEYLVIDEAHRIKNDESKLSKIVRLFRSKYRLLLTGTPLQNNMKELWSLLNFLCPEIFNDCAIFTDSFSNHNLQNNAEMVHKLHEIIRPFMLRRLKRDVLKEIPAKIEICLYCGMSALQKKWYKNVLSRNIDEINRRTKSKTRLLNILMQLRKVCNHPYLFEGAEEGPPFVEGKHLYFNCGKLALLDKLLHKLFAQKSRVLLFSQMTRMLDILEDYMCFREYKYCRIDGSTKQSERNEWMDDFNAPNSEKQVFLLSTRAGGLGINLQSADIVILYDSDWNPQMDIQAQDRAHRIGQKKTVYVYRLITEHSVEEKILDRCLRKLYLNAVVVRKGAMLHRTDDSSNNKSELMKEMVRFGAEYILRTTESTISDRDIDELIRIGEKRTEETKSNISQAFDHNIMDFKMDLNDEHNYQEYEGMDYSNINKKKKMKYDCALVINHGPRQRNLNVNYAEDAYFKKLLQNNNKKEESWSAKTKRKRIFKVSLHSKYKYDFQFVTDLDRLHALEKKAFEAKEEHRIALWREKQRFTKECIERKEERRRSKLIEAQKMIKLRRDMLRNGGDTRSLSPSMDTLTEDAFDETLEWNKRKQEIEDNIAFLNKKEEKEMQRLMKDAVIGWNLKDYNQLIAAMVQCGRDNIEDIAQRMENKRMEEIEEYHGVFWKKYRELKNWKKVIRRIDDAENKREENERYMDILNNCIANKRLNAMQLIYKIENEKEILVHNGYTVLLDRFIISKVAQYGLDSWDIIRKEILKCKLFWNQWIIRSKTENEIKHRALKLLHLLDVDLRQKEKKKKGKSERRKVSVLCNKSRKRLTKTFIQDLVERLKPNTMIEIYDEDDDEWNKCRVIKHCDKDTFCLMDVTEEAQYEEQFKCLEFRVIQENDNGDANTNVKKKKKRKKTRKRKKMNQNKINPIPSAKRRKVKK